MNVEINTSRLDHLLDLYRLSREEFLTLISEGLKKKLTGEQVFTSHVSIDHLKRVDKLFKKGLSYYLDPTVPVRSEAESVFFRKSEFATDLNLAAKKKVDYFERLKIDVSIFSKAADIESPRILPFFSVKDNPLDVAKKVRGLINFSFRRKQKDFLESLINKLGDCNILVFEFVETWNQKDKANIDGFYLSPNVIVLKRLDGFSYRREIFTLAHELGHYLLNIEEVEEVNFESASTKNLSDVEKWCNLFAFHFLIGNLHTEFSQAPLASLANDYNHQIVQEISEKTNLSRLALFTQLLNEGKISPVNYVKVKADLDLEYRAFIDDYKQKQKEDKENGVESKGGGPVPIKSDFLVYLVRTAFHEGAINEWQAGETLSVTPKSLHRYLPV